MFFCSADIFVGLLKAFLSYTDSGSLGSILASRTLRKYVLGSFHGIGEVISKNKMFESRQNTNWMCYIYISTNLKTKIWVKMFTY